ncbi:MAG: sulfite oxidase-like oxidoreductase [Planctomycetaceae bacterium]|nr:sulfite oxidase-like oxidoreductase [Planctomycetaceae bacterium]
MFFFARRPWDLPQRQHTPEAVYADRKLQRREFLTTTGLSGLAAGLGLSVAGCGRASKEEVQNAGGVPKVSQHADIYPAQRENRNPKFEYGRAESAEEDTAEFTNFYEFSSSKSSWRYIGKFRPDPWKVEITGLCAKPVTLDMDDFYKHPRLKWESRDYRHRCVETWAMCLPWTGFALRDLIRAVEPLPAAKYVKFVTFDRPLEAPHMSARSFPWPYTEGLTMAEATNELAFVATGVFGHPLPKQNGAPIRIVLPWKYGFKSIKSIVRIELADTAPPTFWNTINADEYDFQANVNPAVPHPRWSQRTEWMLGTREVFKTVRYNGYGDWVGKLYPA